MNATVNPGKSGSEQNSFISAFLALFVIFLKRREITKFVWNEIPKQCISRKNCSAQCHHYRICFPNFVSKRE